MENKKEEAKTPELDVLFPNREVDLANGQKMKIRPLALEDLNKVFGSYLKIATLVGSGYTPEEIGVIAAPDISEILALTSDTPVKRIPAKFVCELGKAIIELNFGDEESKKLVTLALKMEKRMAERSGQGSAITSPQQ